MTYTTRRHFLAATGAAAAGSMLIGRMPIAEAAQLKPVKLAWIRQYQPAALVQKGVEFAAEEGLSVELVNFNRALDGMIAMQRGDVVISNCLVGYTQFPLALSQGIELTLIASAVNNMCAMVISRKGLPADQIDEKNLAYIGPTPWKQLVGKKVGCARGSTAEFLLRSYLNAHEMQFEKDIQFVDLKTNGDQVLALQQGSIDVAVLTEPSEVQARVAGLGVLLAFPFDGGEFTRLSSPVVVRTNAIDEYRNELQILVNAHVKAVRYYQSNPPIWVKDSAKVALFDESILERLLNPAQLGLDPKYWSNATLDMRLPLTQIQQYAKRLFDTGFIKKDVTDQVSSHVDYSFLTKATGQSKEELGG